MSSERILLWNLGYCRGFDGSAMQYALEWSRFLHCPDEVQDVVHHRIDALLTEETPDLCCFLEIRDDSPLISTLASSYAFHDVAHKYDPGDPRGLLPAFRRNCNGFFSRRNMPFERRFLKTGMKRLLYDIDLGSDCSLLLVHCALGIQARRRQFAEIRDMIATRERVIVCGDFNALTGPEELVTLTEGTDLQIANLPDELGFPACRPTKALSLYLYSPGVTVRSCRTLPQENPISDHLPVMLEVDL